MYPTSSLLGLEKTQIVTTEGWCWEEADFAVKCTFAFSVYWSFHSCAAYIIFRLFLGRCAYLHGQSMWHYLHHCVQPVLFLEFFVGNFKFAEAYEQNPEEEVNSLIVVSRFYCDCWTTARDCSPTCLDVLGFSMSSSCFLIEFGSFQSIECDPTL
jgi:hypothetical protein